MYYSIYHVTTFDYSAPVRESMMELWMQPRSEYTQRCINFQVITHPRSRILSYIDYQGNVVHHFNVPRDHNKLVIAAEAMVELRPTPDVPTTLPPETWDLLDRETATKDFFDMLQPSKFAQPTALLHELADELKVYRRDDPLSLLLEINTALYNAFDYAPQSTHVDSPIDDALTSRRGVCQDFAHIMIALVRGVGIPCRYVSGYLYHEKELDDRSSPDATHAWVEAWLPKLGWIGFDPTNNVLGDGRHIRVSVGRDYADVPPTRGVFKGESTSELTVEVRVEKLADLPPDFIPTNNLNIAFQDTVQSEVKTRDTALAQQQQQQQ